MKISQLEKRIEISFEDKDHIKNAFVHRSYLNENKSFKLGSNEKLEFLGDSVLSLITSVYLYKKYPRHSEGDYTDIKAAIVKTESLFEAAKGLDLGTYLLLSHGEEDNNGRTNMSILADCFEALIGAIYLDHGFDIAYNFVVKNLFQNRLDIIIKNKLYLSSKNRLQEYWQDKYKSLPCYKLIKESGPEHNKEYRIGAYYKDKLLGQGVGSSKKSAEEKAARDALQSLGV